MTTNVHDVKCWPDEFWATVRGEKLFDVRPDDRRPPVQVGDMWRQREYVPRTEPAERRRVDQLAMQEPGYTGRWVEHHVTYVLRGTDAERWGVRPGYCVIGLRFVDGGDRNAQDQGAVPLLPQQRLSVVEATVKAGRDDRWQEFIRLRPGGPWYPLDGVRAARSYYDAEFAAAVVLTQGVTE